MARLARKQMADMRALDEEAERMNPMNEIDNSYREGYTGLIKGSGATPSMGLSQFRGGRKSKAKMVKSDDDSDDDAKEQGKALSEHLHKLHGSGYARSFHAGMSMANSMKGCGTGGLGTGRYEGEGKMEGGFWGALASIAAPLIGSLFGKGAMTKDAHDKLMKLCKKEPKGKDKLEGGFWGALASLAVPLIGKLFGSGKMTKEAHDELMKVFKKDEKAMTEPKSAMKGKGRMVGAGPFSPMALKMLLPRKEAGIVEGFGTGGSEITSGEVAALESVAKKHKKEKRIVGAGDGRRKRAEVVKRVMKEKGCSMIEASKYVKEHGLY
jgi:hypothetical protein